MYIVTFYSFKGGVGRTMAMVNVGLALAKAGKRVLLVDFDLEAPGLDTFDLLRPERPSLGIVDYVTQFRKTHIAPSVAEFLYAPINLKLDGQVWVMPTGKQDEHYGHRLSVIDWEQLYAKEEGYLLFEDLKEQWKRELKPDYVLIDSRTGHTDEGGICTRQLPDAVVLLFFPNEQNRRGLETVVREIRLEPRPIELHLVAANLPDIDDENDILAKRLQQFQRTLNLRVEEKIHHYDSLSLVEQVVFTMDRPRTRLAREYGDLAEAIRSSNLDDRDLVLRFLEEPSWKSLQADPRQLEDRFQAIRTRYATDPAVLYQLAQANRSLGRSADAAQLTQEAERQGFQSEDTLRHHAADRYAANDILSGRQFARRALDLARGRFFAIEQILELVAVNDREGLSEFLDSLASQEPDIHQRARLAGRAAVARNVLPTIEVFLRSLLSTEAEEQDLVHNELVLCLIGQRKQADAKKAIASKATSLEDLDIQDTFNYAMAEWASSKEIPKSLFERVLALDDRTQHGANYLQCLAIASYGAGKTEIACDYIRRAQESLHKLASEREFSAWRYLRVTKEEFSADLDTIKSVIQLGIGQPEIAS